MDGVYTRSSRSGRFRDSAVSRLASERSDDRPFLFPAFSLPGMEGCVRRETLHPSDYYFFTWESVRSYSRVYAFTSRRIRVVDSLLRTR